MTGREDKPSQQAPRFDYVLYGLPGEVPTVSTDDEPKAGFFGTGKRKLAAGIVATLLLTGGAGGAYAIHERSLQEEADRIQEQVEASHLDVALAAEVEEARAALTEQLDVAREVYAQSRDVLAADEHSRLALRTAIEDAEEIVRAEERVHPIDEVTEASRALTAATEAVETAMDTEARAVLADALTEARTVLADSAGQVADDAVRAQLAERIEHSEELLESQDTSPQRLVELAEDVTAATREVVDAVEAYELDRQAEWEGPAVTPPAQRETEPRRDTDRAADTRERSTSSSSDGRESERERRDSGTEESSSEPSSDPRPTGSPTPSPDPSTGDSSDDDGAGEGDGDDGAVGGPDVGTDTDADADSGDAE